MYTRRSFFQDAALLSALAGIVEQEGYAQPKDDTVSNFWDAYFDEAERDPNQISRGSTDGGLIYPDGIDAKLLLAESDVVVTVNPSHFRPAPDDHKAIARSKNCQIRVDCVQTRPIMNLLAPMAWAGLASWSVDRTTQSATKVTDLNANAVIDPKTGKQKIAIKTTAGPSPPELKDLDFSDPNAPNAPPHNQVILMGGSGRMALNVRGVSQNQRLQTVLDKTVQYSSLVAPFFGFAAPKTNNPQYFF